VLKVGDRVKVCYKDPIGRHDPTIYFGKIIRTNIPGWHSFITSTEVIVEKDNRVFICFQHEISKLVVLCA
jgi:hypothetical protein